MSEQQPPEEQPAEQSAEQPARSEQPAYAVPAAAAAAGPRWSDRTLGLPAVVAIALATLLLGGLVGGLGGLAVGRVLDRHDRWDGPMWHHRDQGFRGPGGMDGQRGPSGGMGQDGRPG